VNSAELIQKALREHVRIHPQERATAALKAGQPIPLSGGEAAYAAQIVLDALAGAGLVVVPVCGCGQPVGTCSSCGKPRCYYCDPGLGKHYQPMKCNERHEPAPAALTERNNP
jgi:hypothetical protein